MLTIVVVSYSSGDVILANLSRLLAETPYRVLIMENGRADPSLLSLLAVCRNVQLIQLKQNMGYGRAANEGFSLTTTPYLLLVNPDLELTLDHVRQMLEFHEQMPEDVAVTAPALIQRDFTRSGAVFREWVVGAAMMFRRQALIQSGGFDPRIFLFFEETELCWRYRKQGLRIAINSDCHVVHKVGSSTSPSAPVERLKQWHFGWSSQFFAECQERPVALRVGSMLHSFIKGLGYLPWSPTRSRRHLQRARGKLARLLGQSAFDTNGRPWHDVTPR